ncbi:MAG: hypothetical protein IKN53_00900, partial [Oscillibacter sp.]|nr:hypothetical protein [Oscillibacter sp.]
MDKKRRYWITLAFCLIAVLIVAGVLVRNLRRTAHVVLPPVSETSQSGDAELHPSGDALRVIEVRPDTVQSAVRTLARPQSYSRTVSIERFWKGGSAVTELETAVSGEWTRVDRTVSALERRHVITNGETTYIWYNQERKVYSAASGDVSADDEQQIPTYENLLALPSEDISAADYRTVSGVPCIYAETAPNEAGYVSRYWVSVET